MAGAFFDTVDLDLPHLVALPSPPLLQALFPFLLPSFVAYSGSALLLLIPSLDFFKAKGFGVVPSCGIWMRTRRYYYSVGFSGSEVWRPSLPSSNWVGLFGSPAPRVLHASFASPGLVSPKRLPLTDPHSLVSPSCFLPPARDLSGISFVVSG